METQKELKATEGFDWLESTELVIDSENCYSIDYIKSNPSPR